MGGDGGGEHEAARQHSQHHGNDNEEGEGVVRLAAVVGLLLPGGLAAPGQAVVVQLEHEPPQQGEAQQGAGHGQHRDHQGRQADLAQGGDHLVVGAQVDAQGDNEDHEGRELELAHPHQGTAAQSLAGAQKGTHHHQADVDCQIAQGTEGSSHSHPSFIGL